MLRSTSGNVTFFNVKSFVNISQSNSIYCVIQSTDVNGTGNFASFYGCLFSAALACAAQTGIVD